MKWIKFKDQMPAVGKRVIVTRPGSETLGILTIMYQFIHEEDKEKWFPRAATEEMIRSTGGYWLEIPNPPKENN
jgi:hypothetical protein